MTKVLGIEELSKFLETTPPLSYRELPYNKESSVESVTIPEGYEEIEHDTFNSILGLKKITLPATLKKISCCAFGDCKDLILISCSSPVVKVESCAFSGCRKLEEINISMEISMDIANEDGLRGLFSGFVPESLKTFRLGKMVDGKVVSKTYKACDLTPLPSEIRIEEDDEEYAEYRHQYQAVDEDEQ